MPESDQGRRFEMSYNPPELKDLLQAALPRVETSQEYVATHQQTAPDERSHALPERYLLVEHVIELFRSFSEV
jgi:hypothetical protein